ncbi:MAG TPA: patatin-like phospholipase family protein [Clostridiales bacterium]|nr:patatin-like phospholipase family protein [Clostridiales bacterium]
MRGLVLEGGGVKGAFHAGVLKAFFENYPNYAFDGVAGTSIGALNGALIIQDDFDVCYDLWKNASPSMVVDIDDTEIEKIISGRYSLSTIAYFLKKFSKVIGNKGLSIDKLEELVDKYIDEEKLRSSNKVFGIVTVNISDNWEALELFIEDIPNGELGAYIMASAYFPAFNRPNINGKNFMDGGLYNNLPINLLVRKGFTDLLVIRTMSKMPRHKNVDGSIKIDYIEPSEDLGKSFDFRKKNVDFLLKLGYFDGLRYIHNYLGKKFYINNKNTNFSNKLLKKFKKFYEDNIDIDTNNTYAEFMVNIKQDNQLSVLDDDFYAILMLLEQVASKYNIDKFNIYTVEKLVKNVSTKIVENEELNIFEKFLIEEYK